MNELGELSVAEAASTTGVSSKTIRRRVQEPPAEVDGRRPDWALPNAYRDASGQWWIPEADLIAAGWGVGVVYQSLGAPQHDQESDEWRVRAEIAEGLLDEVRERLADKDAIIAAKDRETVALLEQVELLQLQVSQRGGT